MRAKDFPAERADPQRADPQKEADRQTASLAGMAVAVALVVAGLFLVHQLSRKAAVEDCLMAGRLDCQSLVVSAH
jgi:hypothetical protein